MYNQRSFIIATMFLLMLLIPLGAFAENLKVFDIDRQVTKSDRGFPRDDPPAAAANGNWLTPINYAGGTLHMRAEIRGQPVPQSMRLQFCMWQYNFTLETCTSQRAVSGQAGTVVTWTSSIPNMWKKDGKDMDWANPRQRYGLAIKNSSGAPVSDFSGWNWSGEDPDAWYPLDIKFSVVVVPVGGTFVGWTSAVLAAPPGPVGGVTAPSISTQPANQSAMAGQTATFAVVASGTAPLSYQWQRDGANIPGATGASYTTPATTLADNGAVFRCRVSNAAGNVTSAGAVLSVSATPQPIASYNFDEGAGATVNDRTGNGYNGTVVGAAWTAAGKNAGALSFDGVDDYVGLGTWGVPGNALTISAWVKGDTWANGDARFIAKAVGTAEQDHVFMLGERDNRLRARLKTNGQTRTLIASSATLPVNTWVHVAAVYDGSTLKLYQNGAEVGSLAMTGSIGASSAPIHIGRSPEGSNYFAGTLDDVRIYAMALSRDDILADMNTPVAAGNVAPTARFSVTPQSGAAPLTVNLNASASSDSDGALVSYAWNFGDGAVGSGVTTSHTYAAAGSYTVQLTVTDDAGAADTATATVTVLSSGGSGIVSDDFNTPTLDGMWTFQNPVGDGDYELVGAGTENAHLRLSVPAGANHDVWTGGNRAVRVMQPAANDDFGIEVKFESQPTQRFQMQGLLVEQDPQNFLRLDFHSDGSALRLFAARFVGGVPTTLRNQTIAAAPVLYLRLTRQGDTWMPQYSYDGSSWVDVSGFTHALAVTSVGVFAGNAGGNPAFTAVVDYFFNTASPIVPEDGPICAPGELFSLTTTASGPGSVLRAPNQATYGCGESVTLTAQPGPGAQFTGWGGALGGTTNPAALTLQANTTVTASFAADTTPPVIGNVQVTAGQNAATVSWSTNEPSTGVVNYGQSTAYGLSVSSSSLATAHSVNLTGLAAGTLHHYRIQATDAAGNSASTADLTFTTLGQGGNSPPVIDIWYGPYQTFGQLGIPQRWINILGNVTDPDGISSLSYSLNGGSQRALSIGPDNRRLADPGDFIIEIDHLELAPGWNDVVISATDNLGSTSVSIVNVEFGGGAIWPRPYAINWSDVVSLQDVIQVVDGNWAMTDEGIRTVQVDYDRLLAIGDIAWQSYEITVPVTIHGSEPSGPVSGAPGVGIILRWKGHTNSPVVCVQPHCGWLPSGPIGWWRASKFTLADQWDPDVVLQLGIPYIWKKRVQTWDVEGQPYHMYSLKVWQAGDSEPLQWNLTKTYPGGVVTNGSALLIAHHMDVTFGDMTVVSLDNVIPPAISNVQVIPGETTAIITWTTNVPATSRVAYGLTSSHEAGTIVEDTLKTSHSLMLTDLEPGALYHYQVSSLSSGGDSSISQNFVFKTNGGQDLSGIVSDDFNTPWLNPVWEYQDPVGDGTYELVGAGTGNAHLRLSVPAGTNHDVWTGGNRSVRVMQPSLDENLEIEVKFESQPTQRFQMQGLLVEQDPQNFLRVDFYSDGSSLRLFAARFTGGVPQTLHNQVIAGHPNLYLRLTRQGNIWTPQHSSDGTNWTVLGSFTQAMTVSKVGVFAGNSGANPAYTAVVDYFFNTASPVVPEDGAGE
jgi:PKD repeat protein